MTDIVPYETPREALDNIVLPRVGELLEELIEVALSPLEEGLVKPKDKLQALTYLVDRVYGKAATEIIQRQEGEVKVTIERVEARTKEEFQRLTQGKIEVVDGNFRSVE